MAAILSLLACAILIRAPFATCTRGDDFVFDNSDEIQIDAKTKSNEVRRDDSDEMKRLWGVPDTTAYVGYLYRLEISDTAFNQDVAAYKVKSVSRRRAPEWLAVDSRHGLLRGVPTSADIGTHTLSVTAYGHKAGQSAVDTFTIEVKSANEKPRSGRDMCPYNSDKMELLILIDANYHKMTSRQRTRALMELAKFMAVPEESFYIESYKPLKSSEETTVLMSGSGETRTKKIDGATAIHLTVGCNNRMWQKHKLLVHQLGAQAKDGTLSHILQLPTLGWRLLNVRSTMRSRRQIDEGSGDDEIYDDGEDYSGLEADDIDDEDYPFVTSPHPHRHHHGEHSDRTALHHNPPHITSNTPFNPAHKRLPYQTPHLPSFTPRIPPFIPNHTHSVYVPTILPFVITPHTVPPKQTTQLQFTTNKLYPSTPSFHSYPHFSATSPRPSLYPAHNSLSHSQSSIVPVRTATTQHLPPTSVRAFPSTVSRIHSTIPNHTTVSFFPPTFHFNPSTTLRYSQTIPYRLIPPATSKIIKISTSTTSPSPSSQNTVPDASTSASNAATIETSDKESLVASTQQSILVTDRIQVEGEDKKLSILPTIDTTTGETKKTAVSPVENVPKSTTTMPSSSTTAATTTLASTSTQPIIIVPSSEITPPNKQNSSITTQESFESIDDLITQSGEATTEIWPVDVSQQEPMSSTGRTSTISGQTTETIDFPVQPNQPPVLQHHVKKLAVTAGKAFRYILPADLFLDHEDGAILNYSMLEADGRPLKSSSWVQFLTGDREVYGLPLNEHASRWNYIIEAADQKGASARAPLDITVQQHKGLRTVTNEFNIQVELQKPFKNDVDWQIQVLEALVNLFRDVDMDNLTVRNVSTNGNIVEFVWTNDSLPKDRCKNEDIDRIMSILQSDDKGTPSESLSRALSPDMRVLGVKSVFTGPCKQQGTPAPAPAPPATPADNFGPVVRNQIDHLRIQAGQLLVYTVPEDTFFDPEDGSTRQLSLRVYSGNRVTLPTNHWLQFDVNNQELYGLPLPEKDVGKMQYQLVATDSGGKMATDVLIVEVEPAPSVRHNAEFSITMDIPYESIAMNARQKRAFIERLYKLFGDRDASNISIKSITPNPTTVIWHNTSLPTDHCPSEALEQLKKIVSEENGAKPTLSLAIVEAFGSEFNVMSVRQEPTGLCLPNRRGGSDFISGNIGPVPESEKDDYLLTFIIPLAAVVVMVLLAGLIAILLRRRHAHKLNLGDDLERTAFRNRGIPVIFQDELDDRVEARQAAPLIMQAEKPPLAPSPRAPRAPYRAPPPLASSATARHPPAPHYRKPPPYVPP